MHFVAIVVIISGVFFFLVGAIGIIRFPDFYTRMHAAGKCDTLGSLLMLFGLAIYNGLSLTSVKIMLIALFLFLTSPTATHSIARAALKHNIPYWQKKEDK